MLEMSLYAISLRIFEQFVRLDEFGKFAVGHLGIQYGGRMTSFSMVPSDWSYPKTWV
jgi:hypothetical protein